MADYTDVIHVAAELSVTIGLLQASMAMDNTWPDEVKENFQVKIDGLVGNLQREYEEFIQFGKALDGEDS